MADQPIKLTDAAIYYKEEPHQTKAWEHLQETLSPRQLETFQLMYRHAPQERPSGAEEGNPQEPAGYVTPDLMHRLTGYPASSFDSVFCNDCNKLFADTGFDKHLDAMQMLMANLMHETCNFVYMEEIASGEAYNYRTDLGNRGPDDGPTYKGAGVLMLTGRYNYQKLADGIHDPKVMDGVHYVANTYPFTSARIWIVENDLLNVCLNQGFDACCVRINGGWNGNDDRLAKYQICKREMQ